jgi:hypothetical protein
MSNDNTALCEQPTLSLQTLPSDPLMRMVMHADGLSEQDLLAALRIAYKAVSTAVCRHPR